MSACMKALDPTPGFPAYTGPYKVGTIDVEIPVAELESPAPAPAGAAQIPTVLFRVWYPCVEDAKEGGIDWLPKPQRKHARAYTKFLGAGAGMASFISYFQWIFHYITIPVHKNAKVLESGSEDKSWPVMLFSHGLGGNRNTYSHLCGSVASHGVIVVTPEHRDGSAVVSYIRDPTEKHKSQAVKYKRVSLTASPEVDEIRTAQLKTRMWELGLIHDALLKIDRGTAPTNLNTSSSSLLPMLASRLGLHKPGSIVFAGHSFGAATVAQFVKSIFYERSFAPPDFDPPYTPAASSAIKAQITQHTPLILLDIWLPPLRAPAMRWLWDMPLPCYATGGRGGMGVLAVESQAFFKWHVHLKLTKRFLSYSPGEEGRADLDNLDPRGRGAPRLYYVASSAHISQSDFGLLFPWMMRKFMGCAEPERVIGLNVRAVLRMMSESKCVVAGTGGEDEAIFNMEGKIRGWLFLGLDVSDIEP